MVTLSYESRARILYLTWGVAISITTIFHLRELSNKRKQKQLGTEQSTLKHKVQSNNSNSQALKSIIKLLYKRKIIAHAAALFVIICARLFVSIRISRQIGKLGSYLSSRRWNDLRKAQIDYALWTIPGSALNALVEFASGQLALSCREALVNKIHDAYKNKKHAARPKINGFKLQNNVSEKAPSTFVGGISSIVMRIDNPDQIATEDIDKLSADLATIFLSIVKPLAESSILTATLVKMMGPTQVFLCYSYFFIASSWSRAVTPSLTSLSTKVQECEAEYRSTHTRIVKYAEEIDFLQSTEAEGEFLNSRFRLLALQTFYYDTQKFFSSILDTYIVRYMGILTSLAMMSPILRISGRNKVEDPMEFFLTCFHLLVNLMSAFKDIATAARTFRSSTGIAERVSSLYECLPLNHKLKYAPPHEIARKIRLEDVTIAVASDCGNILFEALSLEVNAGDSLFIKGPNGIGKTSLFRVLRGIWVPVRGRITMPPSDECYFLVSKPYMVSGLSLREQVLYPFPQRTSSISDKKIAEVLKLVGLLDVRHAKDEFALLKRKITNSSLSAGEAQRLACARMLLYKPSFVFVDEGTSSCTADFEEWLFKHCICDLKITMLSISHRGVGEKYHSATLHLHPNGSSQLIKH